MRLVPVLVMVISAVACHLIARAHGGNAVFWGVMGAVFGPFAIPVVLIVMRYKQRTHRVPHQ